MSDAVTIQQLLGLSAILFTIGLIGVMTRRNIILILLSLELMLSAANLAFVSFAYVQGDLAGQIMVFFVMIVAAAEVTVGLAVALLLSRKTGKINADEVRFLKW